MSDKKHSKTVETTGHVWDGDLQEYDNPIPTWWLWTFYASAIFVLVYWVLYPTWPVGLSYTKGMMNNITFMNDEGEEVTTHWNTRALLAKENQTGKHAMVRQEYLEKIGNDSFEDIVSDPEKLAFARSMSKVLFADNCAACHGSGAEGVIGLFPNLIDDAWLWGGTADQIHETLVKGRVGFMPGFEGSFTGEQLDAVASYVLESSGVPGGSAAQIADGEQIFKGETGGCYYCHAESGEGMLSQGSANLTDAVWTVADVPGGADYAAKHEAVKSVILDGIDRVMPGWTERLSEQEIKMLTVYVHQLGGGK